MHKAVAAALMLTFAAALASAQGRSREVELPLAATAAERMRPAHAVPALRAVGLDRAAIAAEDAERRRDGLAPRFAIPQAVSLTPDDDGGLGAPRRRRDVGVASGGLGAGCKVVESRVPPLRHARGWEPPALLPGSEARDAALHRRGQRAPRRAVDGDPARRRDRRGGGGAHREPRRARPGAQLGETSATAPSARRAERSRARATSTSCVRRAPVGTRRSARSEPTRPAAPSSAPASW